MTTSPTDATTRYQLTSRDKLCLIWIAMQYAIRLDQLRRLLFRFTPVPDRHKLKPGADCLSLDRTYEIISKWVALGLIEKKTILHGDKLWIWLSRQGLRELELSFNYSGAPASEAYGHRHRTGRRGFLAMRGYGRTSFSHQRQIWQDRTAPPPSAANVTPPSGGSRASRQGHKTREKGTEGLAVISQSPPFHSRYA